MRSRSRPQSGRRSFLVTIVAAAAVAFALASYRVVTSDLDVLLTMVPDDAFYYLQIARHLARVSDTTQDDEIGDAGHRGEREEQRGAERGFADGESQHRSDANDAGECDRNAEGAHEAPLV